LFNLIFLLYLNLEKEEKKDKDDFWQKKPINP
jgi:hypothetical protein